MSAVIDPSPVYRRQMTYVVLPPDLARFHGGLVTWFAEDPDVQVLVDRRTTTPSDRRRRSLGGPGGVERRGAERRQAPWQQSSAAELGLELPWTVARHAAEIPCAQRSVPVAKDDAAAEADALFARACDGDQGARDELRLRFHPWVHAMVTPVVGKRRALATADRVLEDVFTRPTSPELRVALVDARERVLGS